MLESVHCFGHTLSGENKYYHGIDCKLLFDRFNVMLDVPCSLTLDKDFAYTFSSGSPNSASKSEGIMVELNHGTLSDLQSLCLDTSSLSEFPMEEERLLFHSYVSMKDIVIRGLHHDQWLKIFRFWYKLKEGFFFKHLLGDISKNDQLCICAMMTNMMLAGNRQSSKYDSRIPLYMQCLFNECIQSKAFVWCIESEYVHLAPKLRALLSADSVFMRFLVKHKRCNVMKCVTFNWTLSRLDLDELLCVRDAKWLRSPPLDIAVRLLNRNKDDDVEVDDEAEEVSLRFHFECQEKPKNGLFRCRVHLDVAPQWMSRVNLGIGIYVERVNVDNYSYAEIKCGPHDEKRYNSSLHSLFDCKVLRSGGYSELRLKLQIQLFYLHGRDGKIVKFQLA